MKYFTNNTTEARIWASSVCRWLILSLMLVCGGRLAYGQLVPDFYYSEARDVDLEQLFELAGEDTDWGIQAEMTGPDGFVEVELLALPIGTQTQVLDLNGTNSLLKIYTEESNTNSYSRSAYYAFNDPDSNVPVRFTLAMLDKSYTSKEISKIDDSDRVTIWDTDEYKRAMMRAYHWQKGFRSVSSDPKLKVVLRITYQDAIVHKVKVPGVPPYVFAQEHDVVVDVYNYSDRGLKNSYSLNELTTLDLEVGDSVVFKTTDPTFTVSGLREVWLARTGGESKYYYSPERMAGFKPFIGFDSQVHGVALRKHPDPAHKQYPTLAPVTSDPNGTLYYYWIAEGNVQAGAPAYDPASSANGNIAFEKFKDAAKFGRQSFDIGGGETVQQQRNNQKEGLNVELITSWDKSRTTPGSWSDWISQKIKDFTGYDYNADDYRIVSGLDGDEIVLLEQNTNPANPVGNRDLLQKLKEDWKEMKEGPTLDPVNIMVNFYQRNRMFQLKETNPELYDYWLRRYGEEAGNILTEILDKEQYVHDPSVTEDKDYFNKKRPLKFKEATESSIPVPGLLQTFAINGIDDSRYDEHSLGLNVKLPGTGAIDKPFYSISGENSPAAFQQNVPYTMNVSGMTTAFKNKLVMEYSYENPLGHLEVFARKFNPQNTNNGNWTENFNIEGSGYHEITVYYQFSQSSEKVIIAGKELLEIQLRFLSVPGSNGYKDFYADGNIPPGVDLKEGRGEGNFWYLRDFNNKLTDELAGIYPEEIGRTKEFPYVFEQGQEVSFNIMDADPHTFLHYDVDFYLSERFMSKRLDDAYLQNRIKWYLSADPGGISGAPVGDGRHLTYTFANAGTYFLKCVYNGASSVKAKVIVKPSSYAYDKTNDRTNTAEHSLGKIKITELTALQKDWIAEWATQANGGTTPNLNPVKLAVVDEIYSQFTYSEGPKAQKGIAGMTPGTKTNRYGPQNDFNTNFSWVKPNGFNHDERDILVLPSTDLSQLPEQLDDWYPSSWILHYMPGPDPKVITDIPGYNIIKDEGGVNSKVKAYFDSHSNLIEPWQVRLPWVSQTQWKGYRTRTNIKTLNKLAAIFDNNQGAFSGNAFGLHDTEQAYDSYVTATNQLLPEFTDLQKKKYDFYWKLRSGQVKLIHEDDLATGEIKVNVTDPDHPTEPIHIAKYITPGELPQDWMAGADMSSVPNLEAKGISWGYGQTSVDPYELISDYGMNTVRLRLWVDPVYESSGDQFCQVPSSAVGTSYDFSRIDEVKTQIQRAKAKGLKVLLDLHMSDTWTDPGANIIPESWKVSGQIPDVNTLESTIANYVTNTLQTLIAAGATPDYVQVGNETNSNILLSDEYEKLTVAQIASEIGVTEAQMNGSKFTINWDRNARLLNAGLQAVKSFATNNSVDIKTMVHIAGTYRAQDWIKKALYTDGNVPGESWINRSDNGIGTEVINRGLIDFLGMSYYLAEAEPLEMENNTPSVNIATLSGIIGNIKTVTGLPTVIVETAFPRSYDYSDCSKNQMGFGYRGQEWNDVQDGRGFPKVTSDNLQKQWLLSLIDMLKSTDGGSGLLYWEPFWVGSDNETVPTKDLVGSGWENMSFFTFEHGVPSDGLNILAEGGGMEAFCDGACPDNLTGVVANKMVLMGNIGYNETPQMSKLKSLINSIEPGTIVTLGNIQYPSQANNSNDFYTSFQNIFANHLANGSLFPVVGRADYKDGVSHRGLVGEEFWLDFFGKNETYYSFSSNDVEYFVLNTINRVGPSTLPSANAFTDQMKLWLETSVAASTRKYQVVLSYYSPYTTTLKSDFLNNWDFKAMGVDLFVSSSPSYYERHDVNGVPFVNVGLGGSSRNENDYSAQYPATLVEGTHYAKKYGVLTATTGSNMMMFQFINEDGDKIDQFYLINRDDEQQGRVDSYDLQGRRGTALTNTSEALDVWLILGQSNAEGRCGSNYCYDEFTGDETGELTKTYLLNEKGQFEQAKNALARYSSVGKIQFTQALGFGWTFAQTLNNDSTYGSTKLGLIVNPIGGTDLDEWMPDYVPSEAKKKAYGKFSVGYGGENLYNETLRRVNEAVSQYSNLNFKGIIWAQGENDAQRINNGELNYAQKARALYNEFASYFADEDLLFLIPEVSYRPDLPAGDEWSHTQLNAAYHAMADLTPNIRVASAAGMSTFDGQDNNTKDTGVHWDHDSYRMIGVRLANLFLNPASGARIAEEEEDVLGADWSVNVYPNPVRDGITNIQIEVPESESYELTLIDLKGNVVYESELILSSGVNHTVLSVSSLASGVYALKITGSDQIISQQLIIQH